LSSHYHWIQGFQLCQAEEGQHQYSCRVHTDATNGINITILVWSIPFILLAGTVMTTWTFNEEKCWTFLKGLLVGPSLLLLMVKLHQPHNVHMPATTTPDPATMTRDIWLPIGTEILYSMSNKIVQSNWTWFDWYISQVSR
jgi:hypothetical protein